MRSPLSHRLLPFLNWPRPSWALLRGEALAGLTVGLMVIPQGVAYAALAGMPVVTGIYAAMLPALVAALFSASPRLAVGPTALTCLLISASLTGLAEPGSAQWVALAGWLALLCGLLQVALGAVRAGWLLNVVNAPVLMAFTQAAAFLIVASQLPALLGLQGPWAEAVQNMQSARLEPHAAAFGLGTLALLWLGRRLSPAFPSVLLVVVASAGLSQWLGFAASGGAVVGSLPQGLPALGWPAWPGWTSLNALWMPVLVITLVSFLETASSAKVDSARSGTLWNREQDLIGQGLAKIVAGLVGSFATSSSFGRSALNLYAGARSAWATVFSVVVVALTLLFFLPVLQHVPQSVLAAVVVVAVVSLIRPLEFHKVWRLSRVEAAIALCTFVVTLVSAPQLHWGVLTGVLLSLLHFLYQRLHPRIIEVGLHADGRLRDRHLWHLPPIAAQTYALRMDAELDFSSATALQGAVAQHLAAHPEVRHVVLLAQPINHIDATGAQAFLELREQLAQQQRVLHVVGVKTPVEEVLRRAGALDASAWFCMHVSDGECLSALAPAAAGPDRP